jgi:hypothetical protein
MKPRFLPVALLLHCARAPLPTPAVATGTPKQPVEEMPTLVPEMLPDVTPPAASSDAGAISLPVFECSTVASGPPRVIALDGSNPDSPYLDAPPKPNATEVSNMLFGGRRFLERTGQRSFVNVGYRDHFHGPAGLSGPESIAHGLRALAHYEGQPGSGASQSVAFLVFSKRPCDVLFTESFDPSRHIWKAHGSFAQWPSAGLEFPQPEAPPGQPQPGGYAAFTGGMDGELRPVLSTRPGHANGVLLLDRDVVFWVGRTGAIRPVPGGVTGCGAFNAYVDARGKLLLACQDFVGVTTIKDADGTRLFTTPRAPPGPRPLTFQPPPGSAPAGAPPGPLPMPDLRLDSADAIAVDKNQKVGILRLPSGWNPATAASPAMWLTKDTPPVELAPWSTLELASSPACSRTDDGVRAIFQTPRAWAKVAGSGGFFREPGMTALVRWSVTRVCLEAIELGYRGVKGPRDNGHAVADVMLVARFIGEGAGAAFAGLTETSEYSEPVSCNLRMPSAK